MMLTDRVSQVRGQSDQQLHTSTHLLRDHDHKRGQRRASYPCNSEELPKSSQVPSSAGEVFFTFFDVHFLDITISEHNLLKPDLRIDIIEIAGCLQGGIAQTT